MARTEQDDPNSKESYLAEPKNGDEFYQRGWDHYSKKEHYRAEADFRKALELSPDHPDILYALGLTLQASGRQQDAIHTFEKVLEVLSTGEIAPELRDRVLIMTRLTKGHINRMKTGNWNMSL